MCKNTTEALNDYYSGAISYLATKHEPLKWQITGDALIHIRKFINFCFKKEKCFKKKYLQYNKKSVKY